MPKPKLSDEIVQPASCLPLRIQTPGPPLIVANIRFTDNITPAGICRKNMKAALDKFREDKNILDLETAYLNTIDPHDHRQETFLVPRREVEPIRRQINSYYEASLKEAMGNDENAIEKALEQVTKAYEKLQIDALPKSAKEARKKVAKVECKFCRGMFKTSEIKRHMTKECQERTVECPLCLKEFLAKDLKKHQERLCGNRKITCAACGAIVLAKDQAKHAKECSREASKKRMTEAGISFKQREIIKEDTKPSSSEEQAKKVEESGPPAEADQQRGGGDPEKTPSKADFIGEADQQQATDTTPAVDESMATPATDAKRAPTEGKDDAEIKDGDQQQAKDTIPEADAKQV
jgi:hypothetical protein